jgi:hypothetical protein
MPPKPAARGRAILIKEQQDDALANLPLNALFVVLPTTFCIQSAKGTSRNLQKLSLTGDGVRQVFSRIVQSYTAICLSNIKGWSSENNAVT